MTEQDRKGAYESEGMVWIRDKATGRLEREAFGSVRFRHVPPSPYWSPKPGWWGTARAWLDLDGRHVVAAHDCRGTREVHLLPWPVWQAVNDSQVTPSYSCERCGLHTFLRIEWTVVDIPGDLAKRRSDESFPAFQARLRERIESDKALLARLAESDG